MKIRLKHLLELVDNKEYIELYVYHKYTDTDYVFDDNYCDMPKSVIYSNLRQYLNYHVITMYALDKVLHIEVAKHV